MDTPTTDIGPGLGAFVAFFLLAVMLWFLMRNMNSRMRRMAYAERDRVARVDAEVLAAEAEEHTKTAAERGGSTPGQSDGPSQHTSDPDGAPPSSPPAGPTEAPRQEPDTPSA